MQANASKGHLILVNGESLHEWGRGFLHGSMKNVVAERTNGRIRNSLVQTTTRQGGFTKCASTPGWSRGSRRGALHRNTSCSNVTAGRSRDAAVVISRNFKQIPPPRLRRRLEFNCFAVFSLTTECSIRLRRPEEIGSQSLATRPKTSSFTDPLGWPLPELWLLLLKEMADEEWLRCL